MSIHFGKPIQMGFIVSDVDAAVAEALNAGVGPFYIHKHYRNRALYDGKRSDVEFSCAFGYTGELQIEFIHQENDADSSFKRFMDKNPEGGFHHLAYYTKSIPDSLKYIEEKNLPYRLAQEFLFPDDDIHEVYLEPTSGHPSAMAIQLVNQNYEDSYRFFEDMKLLSKDWDGSRPIRELAEIIERVSGGSQ